MYQAIQKSKLLIRSLRAISQTANITPIRIIPSFANVGARCFSTNPSQSINNASGFKKSGNSDEKESIGRFRLSTYYQDGHIPNYSVNTEELSDIVEGEFRNSLVKSREYLKSAKKMDVNHMRACALMEMTVQNFDGARSILRPLYRLHPENESILSDLCLLEDGAGNDKAFIQYSRALKRLQNRKAALASEIAPLTKTLHERHANIAHQSLIQDPTPTKSGLVDLNELTFLSHEDERHVHRTLASEALAYSPKNSSMVLEWAKKEAERGYIDKAIEILHHAISFYDNRADAGILNLELAKYYYFLNNIPKSTEALKVAIQNPRVKPMAIQQLAEMNELVDSPSAALEFYQFAVDQEDSDPQTWKFYLDFLKGKNMNDLYKKVALEAFTKYPDSRVLNAHYVASLVKNKEYDAVYSAIEEMVAKNPSSVFTYEYLLSACDDIADPRILNTIYSHATTNINDNAFLFIQYGEFLEEMNEYAGAKAMFAKAYSITPTDDLARSIVRMAIELNEFEEASAIIDVLIDEYSDEVELRDNRIMWNRDANKAYRFIHKEEETEDEIIDQDYDDFYKEEHANWLGIDTKTKTKTKSSSSDDHTEPYRTTSYMMPRLLTDKAIIANRMQQFDFAERLFENALELDPSDPYIILNAIEEYYEPSEQWDKIIYLFSILPVVDPNHEFMAEARSLRQSILETIQETEATNQQIYDLYHIPDYSSPMEKGELVDYFGRDIHQHSPINDGFNQYGYQHAKLIDRENDHKLKQFNFNVDDRLNVEKIPVASFYKNIPENLLENYSNTNWYELPIMKEWMEKVPNEHAGESIDWKSMRNDKGNLEVPYFAVFDKHDSIKVSMKDLENLRVLLAKEYTTVPTAMKEGMKDQEHAYEMKTQEQLIKEIRKNIGEAYFDWSFIDNDLQFPVEKEDFALSHLLNDSLKRYSFDFMGKKKDN